MGVGLSLEAAPFSLSLNNNNQSMICNSMSSGGKDYRSEKKQVGSFRLDLALIVEGQDSRTTVMIKNIPNKYT